VCKIQLMEKGLRVQVGACAESRSSGKSPRLAGTVLSPRGSVVNYDEAMLMQQYKYHIRVMRPTFERAILTVEASSEEAATQAALDEAGRLTDEQWALLGAEREEPVVEIVLPEEEAEGSGADVLAFLRDAQHAYALLQADLAEGSGSFIVPTWLRRQPGLAVADVTRDWNEALSGVYEEGLDAFITWLSRQTRSANVVNFFAERDKRRGKPSKEPDGS
jgi:hypothetical protein